MLPASLTPAAEARLASMDVTAIGTAGALALKQNATHAPSALPLAAAASTPVVAFEPTSTVKDAARPVVGAALGVAGAAGALLRRRCTNCSLDLLPGEGLAEGAVHSATLVSSTEVSGTSPATAAMPSRRASASKPCAPPVASTSRGERPVKMTVKDKNTLPRVPKFAHGVAVVVPVAVALAVAEDDAEGVAVAESVAAEEALTDGVGDGLRAALAVRDAFAETEAVALALPLAEAEAEADADAEGDADAVVESVHAAEGEREAAGERDAAGEADGEEDGDVSGAVVASATK